MKVVNNCFSWTQWKLSAAVIMSCRQTCHYHSFEMSTKTQLWHYHAIKSVYCRVFTSVYKQHNDRSKTDRVLRGNIVTYSVCQTAVPPVLLAGMGVPYKSPVLETCTFTDRHTSTHLTSHHGCTVQESSAGDMYLHRQTHLNTLNITSRVYRTRVQCWRRVPVSYTHLTLPTNREV